VTPTASCSLYINKPLPASIAIPSKYSSPTVAKLSNSGRQADHPLWDRPQQATSYRRASSHCSCRRMSPSSHCSSQAASSSSSKKKLWIVLLRPSSSTCAHSTAGAPIPEEQVTSVEGPDDPSTEERQAPSLETQ